MTAKLPSLPSPSNYDIAEKSAETMQWLRDNIKVGFTDERGPAWWADATTKDGQWLIPDGSHFDGPVPMDVVAAQLDVHFAKGTVNVVYEDADGNRQVATDPRTQPVVNIRTGQVFSYPRAGYKIHPYTQTLSGFIQAIQYDQAVAVGSVGLLKGGGQAFLQARLPDTLEVAGYGYVPYLMAVTSVDLSRSTSYSTGMLGAVCDNTVSNALLGALSILKIKHTRNSALSVQHAREKLGVRLAVAGEEIGEAITRLTDVDVSSRDFTLWLDEMRPKVDPDPTSKTGGAAHTNAERERAERTRLWTEDPKVAKWAGTAFGILQLDNTFRTWNGIVRNVAGGRVERNFANVANGVTARGDAQAMQALAKVLDRKLVAA